MGRVLLTWRLAIRDIQRRRVQSALLLAMIVTTTTTLTIGLALHRVTDSPFARTRAATRGPDIVAEFTPPPGTRSAVTRGFAPLVHAHGVAGTSGPYPIAFTGLTRHAGSTWRLRSRAETSCRRRSTSRRSPPGAGSRPVRPSSSGGSPMRSASASATRSASAGGRSASPGLRSAPLSASTRSPPQGWSGSRGQTRTSLATGPAADRVHPQPEADRSVVRPGVRERQRRHRVLQRHEQRRPTRFCRPGRTSSAKTSRSSLSISRSCLSSARCSRCWRSPASPWWSGAGWPSRRGASGC